MAKARGPHSARRAASAACGATALPAVLPAQALARPHHVALIEGELRLTYRAWARLSDGRAATLWAAGVRPGHIVAVCAQASVGMAVELMALRSLGATLAPLAPDPLGLAGRLAAVGARFVTSASVRRAALGEALAKQPRLRWLPAFEEPSAEACAAPENEFAPADAAGRQAHGPAVQAVPSVLGGAAANSFPHADLSLAGEAAARSAPLCPPPVPAALSEAWCILCTSGSTGTPKAVSLTGMQIVASTFGVVGRLGSLPQDTWLACLPWHHVGGLMVLWRTVLLGTQAILQAPFSAEHTARLLDANAISLAPLVPTMLAKVLKGRAAKPFGSRLRAIVLGGAQVPAELLRQAAALCLPVATSWGMTEASSQLATRFVYANGGPQDAGPPLSVVSVAVATGGRLAAFGPLVGGSLLTADCGHVDGDGHVQVVGRSDNVLVSGGENVPVEPIEAVLLLHPAVADAAVVGRADALWGQRPVAHLVHRSRPAPSAAAQEVLARDLLAFCRGQMASLHCPVQFVWHEALPRDGLGKLRRRQLLQGGTD